MPHPDDDDLQARLQRSLGRAYTLERELGGGGMSRVFVADEPGLGRKVVVKVMAADLAAGMSHERFEREIKLIASLQQANIVPLLSAGRTDGRPYYTMPLVEGHSLARATVARGTAAPSRRRQHPARRRTRALAYAHEHGIVHRDIKPDNVLLSGDTAVVTDFGIAKALTAAAADPERLTLTGSGIGTPAYMPPEQAVGDPDSDHRADIYAFGCLAYEVFTGSPPFHGLRTHQLLAAHINETPRRVSERRADVPQAYSVLIAKCLEKDPALRPQSARELLQVFDSEAVVPRQQARPAPTQEHHCSGSRHRCAGGRGRLVRRTASRSRRSDAPQLASLAGTAVRERRRGLGAGVSRRRHPRRARDGDGQGARRADHRPKRGVPVPRPP